MKFNYYQDARSEWRWNLKAGNNQVIATGGEGYTNEDDCLHAIDLVKGCNDAPVKKVEKD